MRRTFKITPQGRAPASAPRAERTLPNSSFGPRTENIDAVPADKVLSVLRALGRAMPAAFAAHCVSRIPLGDANLLPRGDGQMRAAHLDTQRDLYHGDLERLGLAHDAARCLCERADEVVLRVESVLSQAAGGRVAPEEVARMVAPIAAQMTPSQRTGVAAHLSAAVGRMQPLTAQGAIGRVLAAVSGAVAAYQALGMASEATQVQYFHDALKAAFPSGDPRYQRPTDGFVAN